MILITGAGKHLGAEIALALAKEGHNVALHARSSQQEIEQIATRCRAYGVEAQTCFGELQEVRAFIEHHRSLFENVRGVVNNVGNYHYDLPSQLTEGLKKLWATNFLAPVALSEACLPSLKRCKGRIVNIGVAGLHAPWTKAATYGLTKQALWHYTEALAKEVAPEGVTVNMVSPGHLTHSVDLPEQLPMGRAGQGSEVAAMVAFLFSEKGSYITGQNIEIAGGLSL